MAISQITPILRSVGRYTVRTPFQVIKDTDYTCVALYTFSDMYSNGIDPYSTVYVPVGLVNGVTLPDGTLFNFDDEALKGINIACLADPSGKITRIPDNYISSVPTTTGIAQERVILSVDLGLLPLNTNIAPAIKATADTVNSYFGINNAQVKANRIASTRTLTYEESLRLKQTRDNAMNLQTSKDAQIADLKNKLDLAQRTNQTYAQILKDNNIMPK